ncbi:uncharacterized protein HMPREF1541_03217 [Cyphellophora europaea CBS 101466]|uniref:SGNH hydrolase-type esterase domain-containing protein n=1 Tax=Cyphellophora europaea (strain CBS 101466) TaxID=1220924 RepID=W2RXW2_CYPE1|nr:uncharacterized protein HMPREF1541_03217 [Cyphellophora europaea CBS 101466]ETN41282.1 hypothetical protein HMPREF1541_03217 [Cyphellophora europaea CBS 101466]
MQSFLLKCLLPLLCLVASFHLAITHPTPQTTDLGLLQLDPDIIPGNVTHLQPRQARGLILRILPLGASIVRGMGSNPKNGFRKPLRDRLRWRGDQVNMIGNQNNKRDDDAGAPLMRNGQHEGVSGDRIDQVRTRLDAVIQRKPNLVLINAGTNDATQNFEPSTARERLSGMIDKIFRESEGAVVVLSTLLVNTISDNPRGNENVNLINNDIRAMVRQRWANGESLYLAEMNDGSFITGGDLVDGTHPDNDGFRKMAAVFDAAIQRAYGDQKFRLPIDTGIPDFPEQDDSCAANLNANTLAKRELTAPVRTQVGSGDHDGQYCHNSEPMGQILEQAIGGIQLDTNEVSFAQLVNQGGNPDPSGALDDLVVYIDPEKNFGGQGKARMFVYVNDQQNFLESKEFFVNEPGQGCRARGVRWGDVNGDGLDDFICIGLDGKMFVSINQGGSPPQFKYVNTFFSPPMATEQRQVKLADIDGDGRLDYCRTDFNGDITCWRNGGIGMESAEYWQDLGIVFTGKGKGNIDGTQFVDINGDHRDDWVWLDERGASDIWTNSRGVGKGMAPHWIQARCAHGGMGEDGARDQIRFARIWAYGGYDYARVKVEPFRLGLDPTINSRIKIEAWRNKGEGGTKLRGDGNRYCDMTGNGRDDYVWFRSTGEMTLYENIADPPNWGQHPVPVYSFNRDRKGLHLADWNGDGKCDVLYVDRFSGAVEWWENTFNSNNGRTPTFEFRGNVQGISRLCREGWGVGLFDLGLRFADISGNGRADYLCIERNGRTTALINEPGGLRDVGQVKFAEPSKDRANIRFADIDGDGKADYIWVDKFNGDVSVWMNGGELPENERQSGSKFHWDPMGKYYDGQSRGANQYYPDFTGNGFADLHYIDPVTNQAWTQFNDDCNGDGSGQDDPDQNPDLPAYDPGDNTERGTDSPSNPNPWSPEFPDQPTWVALGDSYSAGVGAGGGYENPRDPNRKCLTTTNAYPFQLERSVSVLSGKLDFLSCTGDLITHINQSPSKDRTSQVEMLRTIDSSSYDFATLSIGGNDLGFSGVVKWCILGILPRYSSRCEEKLRRAETLAGITNPGNGDQNGLSRNLLTAYMDILDTASADFTLVVTGYAAFFSEANDRCDSTTIGILEHYNLEPEYFAPPLTMALRQRINRGVRAFNAMIQEAVQEAQQQLDNQGVRKRIRYIDIDTLFEGHRFCEPTEGDDIANVGGAWFFLPWGRDIQPDGTSIDPRDPANDPPADHTRRDEAFCEDPYTELECAFAQAVEENPDAGVNGAIYPRDLMQELKDWADDKKEMLKTKFMKAFHPRTIGYAAVKDEIISQHAFWASESGLMGGPTLSSASFGSNSTSSS